MGSSFAAACAGTEPTPTATTSVVTPTSTSIPTPALTFTPAPSATLVPTASPVPTAKQELKASKVEEIRKRGKLIVAVRQEGGPRAVFLDPVHSPTRGLELALSGAIAKQLLGDETRVELRPGPANVLVSTVNGGEVDLGLATIFNLPTTEVLKQQVQVSEPFATGGVALIVSVGGGVSTIKDLDGKKVARLATGRDYRLEFESFAKGISLSVTMVDFSSYDEAAAAMGSGQVQAMLGHSIAHHAYLAKNPGKFAFLDKPITVEQFSIIATKGEGDLIPAVNNLLKELKASGELARIAERVGFPVQSVATP